MTVLQISSLHKEYGNITALHHLDLEIGKGQVFGLLGPNGSGKSTTLGMILDVIRPSAGSYSWFGTKGGHEHRSKIGAILEKPNFYTTFSAQKNLELACKIKGVGEERIPALLELVELTARKDDKFKTFSLGMKQRLAIASALLSDPEVLILDEPTNGLDPKGISEIRELIIRISHTGKTIILASHLLDEVQKVCSHFAILKRGKLIHYGRVDEGFGDEVIMEVGASDLSLLSALVAKHEAYISHRPMKNRIELKLKKGSSAQALSKFLAEQGLYVDHLCVVKKDLEQQFMEITN